MAIVTALIHVFAFGALVDAFDTFGGRLFLGLIALPVLALHVAVWATARFSFVWSFVAALILNVLFAGAGYAFWATKAGPGSISADVAFVRGLWFILAGIVTAALLVGWLRLTRPSSQFARS